MFKPRFRPIDKSIDQAEAHFCYETNLSEAVTPSGAFIPMGSGYLFRFKGRLVNGANTDRLFFDSTNVGTGVRIILTHDFDRIKIKPYTGSTEITVQMPVGELPTDALFELTVYINIATGDYSCLLNNYLAKGTFTPSPSGEVKYTQITGGGSPNRYQGRIYEIDAIDMSPVQGRWVTKGEQPLSQGTYINLGELDWRGVFEVEFDYIVNDPSSPSEAVFGGSATVNDPDFYMSSNSTNGAKIWFKGGNVVILSAAQITQGAQYKIRTGFDGDEAYAYVDGVLAGTLAETAVTTLPRPFWLLGASEQGFDHSNDIIANFRYSGGSGERFYRIDESSGDTVYDTISGQNGTRVNMDASNFEYIPMNSQKWRFHDLQAIDGGVLKSITSDNEITISNYRPDGLKPA